MDTDTKPFCSLASIANLLANRSSAKFALICNAIHESFLWLRTFSLEAYSARNADFQSAVSPNFIRQGVGICEALLSDRRPADCKSAIQQSATLRYSAAAQAALRSSAVFLSAEL